MEPWVTPTIFEEVNVGELENKVVDEYTYAQYVDRNFSTNRLNRLNYSIYQIFYYQLIQFKIELYLTSLNNVII